MTMRLRDARCATIARHRTGRRMPVSDETGSAALEFLGLGVVLLVPLFSLVVALGLVQAATLTTTGAARQAARSFSTSPSAEAAVAAITADVDVAFTDAGLDPGDARVSVSCAGGATASACLAREELVTVTIAVDVSLPFVPAILGLDRALVIPVESSASYRVDRFGATP